MTKVNSERPCKNCHKEETRHSLIGLCLVDEEYDRHWAVGGSIYEPMDNLQYMEWQYDNTNR